jgi:hypothetical protein
MTMEVICLFSPKSKAAALTVGILCLIGLALRAGPSHAGELLDPAVLLQRIKDNGADSVYKSDLSGKKWLAFLKKVETGKKAWLEVAAAIYPATDGGPAEDLTTAVGEALIHSPHDVLLVAAPVVSIEGVCNYSEMTMEYRNVHSPQQAGKDIDARIRVLRGVSGADISAQRDRCIELLQESKNELLNPTWK